MCSSLSAACPRALYSFGLCPAHCQPVEVEVPSPMGGEAEGGRALELGDVEITGEEEVSDVVVTVMGQN